MSLISFSLAVIFIVRLFSSSAYRVRISSISCGSMIVSSWFWNRGRLGGWSRKPGPELKLLRQLCSDSSLKEESETKSRLCKSSDSDPLSSQSDSLSVILRKLDRSWSAVTRLLFAVTVLLFLQCWTTRLSTATLQSTEYKKKR